MKIITIEELKKIQLDLLDDVSAFCKKNNISYFLAYGTLIGAIRHNGYIPWDDDIDIVMPRPDYDKFISMYKSIAGNYEVICHENNPNYGLPFAKVHHKSTIMKEGFYHQDCYGVYIDVFPIDTFLNKTQVRWIQFLCKLLNAKKAIWESDRALYKKIGIFMVKFLLLNISTSKILDVINKYCRKGDYEKADKVGCLCSVYGIKDIYPKEIFSASKSHLFEGHYFQIPSGFHQYLSILYGNYMQLPPEEKRASHHIFKAWWR